MAGVYMRFYVGRSGGSAAHVRYITRPSATERDRDALLVRNYPEYAREGDDYRELRDNLQEYARQQEEDEANQPHRGRGAPRTHYRAVLSFEERVATHEARDMADEWIEREFPDSRAVGAVHQNTDHTHVHVHLQARDIDGYKLQLDDNKYRELDREWADIYAREFGHDRAEEHEAKKEETRAWKADYARAMSEDRDPPEAPERADRPNTAQEIHEREERDYGRDQTRAGGPERGAAAGDQTTSDGERALDDNARQFDRAAATADRADRDAGDTLHAAQEFADRLPEPDHGRAARDRSDDLEDRGR
ncbi:MAG: relaxase/mobilization nuclease domain-containing protein [Chloroflexota bacterium]